MMQSQTLAPVLGNDASSCTTDAHARQATASHHEDVDFPQQYADECTTLCMHADHVIDVPHENKQQHQHQHQHRHPRPRDKQMIPQRAVSLALLLLTCLAMFSLSLSVPTWLAPLSSLFFSASDPPQPQVQFSPAITDPRHLITTPTLISRLAPTYIPSTKHTHSRLLIVGDVHGCASSLDALLHKTNFNPKTDHLILAGDLINKGPASHAVLRRARILGASAVRGNHEDNLLRSAYIPARYRLPAHNPARLPHEKSEKLRGLAESLSEEDYEWLVGLPVILSLGHLPALGVNVSVVHAGLVPGVPLEKQKRFDAMRMRCMNKHHVPSEERVGKPWFEYWNDAQKKLKKEERHMVVYGHDSKMGLQQHRWSIGLDTGCVGGGSLTGLLIKGDKAELVSTGCKNQRD